MAHLEVEIQDEMFVIRSQVFCGTFKNTDENQKALFVFFRLLSCPEPGKALFPNQQIADAFGKKDRRDIDNFVRDFRNRGGDFLLSLARKNTKKARSFPEIERRILQTPLLSIAAQDRMFCEAHPQDRVCEQTFRGSVNEIAATKLLKRVQQLGFKHDQSFDVRRYLEEVLVGDRLSQGHKKELVEQFPEVEMSEGSRPQNQEERVSGVPVASKLLVVLVYVGGLSQEMLALLFGVGKTSIHNWIYLICSEDLDGEILRQIVRWSGQVSFDEKWVTIKGTWYFVLCAVDSVSGFPLLLDLYPTLETLVGPCFSGAFTPCMVSPSLFSRMAHGR